MINFILVASGGFLGAISRYLLSEKLNNKTPFVYIGTFLINIVGSLLLGFFVNIHLHTNANLIFGIGFLGSFTTFSTVNLESITLLRSKQKKQMLIYVFLTYTIGTVFAFIGFWGASFF